MLLRLFQSIARVLKSSHLLLISSFIAGLQSQCNSPKSEDLGKKFYLGENLKEYIHGDSIHSLFHTADSLKVLGDLKGALNQYEIITDKAGSAEELGYTFNQIAICRLLDKDTSEIEGIIGIIDSIFTENSDQDGFKADYYLNLGALNFLKGRYEQSLTDLHLARGIFKKTYGPFHFKIFLTSRLLGEFHRVHSIKTDSAVLYTSDALRIAESNKQLGTHLKRTRLEMARLNKIDRDHISGLNHINILLESVDLDSPEDSVFYAQILTVKGDLLRKINRYDEARAVLLGAIPYVDSSNYNKTALADLCVQILYTAIYQSDSSLYHSFMERFLPLSEELHKGFYNPQHIMGLYHFERGELKLSMRSYEQALQDFKQQKESDFVQVMQAYYDLASGYQILAEFDKAKKYAYESLVYGTSFEDKPVRIRNVFNNEVLGVNYSFYNHGKLAEILLKKYQFADRPDTADLKTSLSIYNLIDSLMMTQVKVVEEDALLNFLEIGFDIYSNAIEAAYLLYRQTASYQYLELVHHFMERSKGLIIFRDVVSNKDDLFPNVPNTVRIEEKELKSSIAAMKQQLIKADQDLDNSGLRELLIKQEDLYERLATDYPKYYDVRYGNQVTLLSDVLQKADSLETTYLQFHWTKDFLYQLTYSQSVNLNRIAIDSIMTTGLSDYISLISRPISLNNREGSLKIQDLSKQLYDRLIKLQVPHFNKGKSLVIIPSGPLDGLPFETLTTERPVQNGNGDYKRSKYLIHDYEVHYAHSIRTSMLAGPKKDFREGKVLAYAFSNHEVDQSGFENEVLPELPYSPKELKQIGSHFRSASNIFRYGYESTKSQFYEDVKKDFNIIHLALHANSSEKDKLDNKVYFRSGSAVDSSNVLFGYEALSLDFEGDLVVLSACRTAKGTMMPGEGTYNLVRAFTQSGASNVISSLWELDDRQTSQIIGLFYNYLKETGNPNQALHQAKVNYLLDTDEIGAHPFYWSGLVGYGS